MPNRKVAQTLDFVEGLLMSADEIDMALSDEIEPRKVLAHRHTNIAHFSPETIQELGKYQGRVIMVALAAELALKYVWEMENAGGAPADHDLMECFSRLTKDHREFIRREYERRVRDPHEEEWKTVDQVFEICRDAFVDWRYIVEEGNYPNYIMRATYLKEAALSVIAVVNAPQS